MPTIENIAPEDGDNDQEPINEEAQAADNSVEEQQEQSTETTPTKKSVPKPDPLAIFSKAAPADDDDEDDDDLDETLSERLWGLAEMFPESLRNVSSFLTGTSVEGTKWLYSVGRVGVWVLTSSAIILALPVMFEMERAQMEEQHLQQQREILLGPNAAVSGAGMMPGGMPQVGPPKAR